MKKKDLEDALNITLNNSTVIFSFPGIGIGNIYPELSGCSLEVREMEKIAQEFHALDIDFIGISTGTLPEISPYIKYIPVKNNLKSFQYITKNDKRFIDRFTIFIHKDTIIKKRIDNAEENAMLVREWIEKIGRI